MAGISCAYARNNSVITFANVAILTAKSFFNPNPHRKKSHGLRLIRSKAFPRSSLAHYNTDQNDAELVPSARRRPEVIGAPGVSRFRHPPAKVEYLDHEILKILVHSYRPPPKFILEDLQRKPTGWCTSSQRALFEA